jgi:hypothetical protein
MPIRQSIQSRNPTIVTNFKNAATKAATRMHRAVFDASDGRVAGQVAGLPVLKLTTTGRKSGVVRATMLTAALHDDIESSWSRPTVVPTATRHGI